MQFQVSFLVEAPADVTMGQIADRVRRTFSKSARVVGAVQVTCPHLRTAADRCPKHGWCTLEPGHWGACCAV